jgi:hypothetical protein
VSDAQVGADVSNFILPPALAGRAWEYLSAIRIAPPSEKLDAWSRTAQLIAGLTGPDFPQGEAAARMWATAETDEVLRDFDTNILQAKLAEGLNDPIFPDEFDQFTLLRDRGKLKASPRRPIIHATPYVWRKPSEIPPRQWLYGRYYIRRFVTATVAPGGLGKSSLAIAETLALVTGRNLLGVAPRERVNAWYWNGEDPKDEIERRIAGLCQHFGIQKAELEDRLFVDSGHDLPIKIAEMNGARVAVAQDVVNEIIAVLRANTIGLLQIDPFISCHGVPENDNGAIDAVAKAWGRIADRANASVSLTHHVRKLAQGQSALTVEDARGAGALMNTARVGRALNWMSEQNAKEASVDDRRFYFRSDNGKANLGPPETTTWFKLVPVPLANGDDVAVVTPWTFPGPLEGVTTEQMHRVRELVRSGSFRKDLRADDWVGHAVADVLGLDLDIDGNKKRLKKILTIWFDNGVLATEQREDEHRKKKAFVIPGDWNEGQDEGNASV